MSRLPSAKALRAGFVSGLVVVILLLVFFHPVVGYKSVGGAHFSLDFSFLQLVPIWQKGSSSTSWVGLVLELIAGILVGSVVMAFMRPPRSRGGFASAP